MSEPWVQIAHQQQQNFIKGAELLVESNQFLFNRLKAAGRVSHQQGDYEIGWKVEIDEPVVNAVGGFEQIEYSANQPYESLAVDWGQYRSTDALHRKEKAIVGGRGEIVNRWKSLVERHTRAHMRNLSRDIYGAGDDNRLLGLQAAIGHSQANTAAGDKIAYPSDTYGGKSTALGAKGGTWTATLTTKPNAALAVDWPFGEGASKYTWNTPILVKTNSTAWDGSNDTWALGCLEQVRYAVEAVRNINGPDGMGDLGVMDGLSFAEFKQKVSAMFSVNKPQFKGGEDTGFVGETLNFEGVTLASDSYCPTGTRFIIQPSRYDIRILDSEGQNGLFYSSGPIWDQFQDGWTFQMGTIIQMRQRVKGLVCLKDFSHT